MISVYEPSIGDDEIAAVVAALRRGEISGNFGEALEQFESQFAQRVGCSYGVATTSGTTALHLAVAAAHIGDGDEIILSSSTNIATALAAVYAGAIPVPADCDDESWNVMAATIEPLITPRTRAIIPVHLFGTPAPMDEIMALAARHDLIVIEDCAQAHGARLDGRPVGSFGQLAAFSFYANKLITTGEGGMVTTNDPMLARRLRSLRNLAFTTPRFRHEEIGFNYRMTGYQAAMGLAQLPRLDRIIARKRELAAHYRKRLAGVPNIQWQREKAGEESVNWMVALRVLADAPIDRDELANCLRKAGIETRTFFCPMNQQPCLQGQRGFRVTDCPNADSLWETGLYLPSTLTLASDEVEHICAVIRANLSA